MADLARVEAELEGHRRSLAMLAPNTPLTRETALRVVEQCQEAVRAARAELAGPFDQ